MAIDNGIAISCADLQASGGIKQILLRSWESLDVVTYDDGAGKHSITEIHEVAPATTATWYSYEFKNETPALTINATKENGSTAFECGLSFTIPKMDNVKFHELQGILSECMMAIAVDSNGTAFVIGASEKYKSIVSSRSQTFANLSGMEGGTGATYNDDNGITVTLMAKQYELPRIYTGVITFVAGGLTATTVEL